jgi:hypothetical protein
MTNIARWAFIVLGNACIQAAVIPEAASGHVRIVANAILDWIIHNAHRRRQ